MPNRITFITENNQTKATFDYDNLPDVQTDAIKKVLGITPSGTINITENGDHDVTNYATASVEVEGGPQPTLFAPVVTGGVNTISWANNTQNGGFNVTLTAVVDGTTVTSPLTITQEMDGKTLTITASATNFEDAVTTVTLQYTDVSSATKLFVTGTKAHNLAIRFDSGIDNNNPIIYDGTSYGGSGIHTYASWLYNPSENGVDIPLIIGWSNSTSRMIEFRYTSNNNQNQFRYNINASDIIGTPTGNYSIAFYDENNNLLATRSASLSSHILIPSMNEGTTTMHMVINLEITG